MLGRTSGQLWRWRRMSKVSRTMCGCVSHWDIGEVWRSVIWHTIYATDNSLDGDTKEEWCSG